MKNPPIHKMMSLNNGELQVESECGYKWVIVTRFWAHVTCGGCMRVKRRIDRYGKCEVRNMRQ